MPNSINSLSPSFRDFLLLKNLVTDTVVDNGLQAYLNGIGYPTQVETIPNAVQASPSIDITGPIYQQLNTVLNPYQGGIDDYTQSNIILNTNATISNQGPYTPSSNNNKLLNNSGDYREFNTIKNLYIDEDKQLPINLNTTPVPTYQNLTSYIDENNNLLVGGPSTQILDLTVGVLGGQGVGIGSQGLIANEDIRATLAGRVLGATGVINDTQLGNISGQQLFLHLGYNAAFGLQQETLGSLNLNPLTLLQGKSLVTLNYSITVPKNGIGKVLNFAANALGVQSPLSLLEESSSIYTFNNKLEYIGMSNIERANEMIKNTGMGQVQALFNHMRANTNISNPTGKNLRQGYAPGYNDNRINKGENTGDGINSNIYARTDSNGLLIDFLNGSENSPITSGNYERSKQISDDGWSEDYFGTNIRETFDGRIIEDGFTWYSETVNNQNDEDANGNSLGDKFGNTPASKKTLLYKTQELFKSGNIKSLVSGHGIADGKSQINSSVSNVGGYTSKGSGVMSKNAILNGNDNGPENVFCRTWTSNDRYNAVNDLQKHRGLYGGDASKNMYRRNIEGSVLEDTGFVRVAPYNTDKMSSFNPLSQKYEGATDNKRYMFSIENLAWADNHVNLLPCEVGPGDPVSGLRGRIMWFPPYDLAFSETTSANWDKHNFIGRGEPLYTYNNTERTGTLSWKVIIDHPNYLNFLKDKDNDYLASYFAGCLPMEEIQKITTPNEAANIQITESLEVKKPEKVEPPKPNIKFDVYYPNDVYDGIEQDGIFSLYENGKCDVDNSLFALIGENPSFSPDGTKVITAAYDKTAKIWNASNGVLLLTLTGHTEYVSDAIFSPDGTKAATAAYDKTAKIWDASNGVLLFTLTGHTEPVYDVNFSPDGTKVVTTSSDNKAKIWNASNGALLFTLTGHTELISDAIFSPDGTKVATVAYDMTAKIWDASNGVLLFTLVHTNFVSDVNFSPDGTKVVTASYDKTAKIWNVSNGVLLFTLTSHTDNVYDTIFSPDGTKVATASKDNTAKIWNASNGALLFTLVHDDYVEDVNFSPDGTKVATASRDNTAKIWDASNGALLSTLVHGADVYYAIFSPDGTKVATSDALEVKIWDATTNYSECFIDYTTNKDGAGFGLGTYYEQCYKYKINGNDKWSSEAGTPNCKQNDGILGRIEPDRTNFGLNATGTTGGATGFKGTSLNGKKYYSWRDTQFLDDLKTYLKDECPACKITITGYASAAGSESRNIELSRLRAEKFKEFLDNTVLYESDPVKNKRVEPKVTSVGEVANNCPNANINRTKDYTLSHNDEYNCKVNRKVTVEVVYSEELKAELDVLELPEPVVTPIPPVLPKIPLARFYNECDYFEKIKETDPVVFSQIKEKIKFFQPAFHSTTPEGFNSRLTFLQQCMRQGMTRGVGEKDSAGKVFKQPDNLAFGRPPVCILRVGDFYHTKIIIESLSFNFDPIVWDLNPEGVGVQPMICNVDISFSFIGGSSLQGPINRLQNAVSFNYFANTEIYDPRADYIKIGELNKGETVRGEQSISAYKNALPETSASSGIGTGVEKVQNQVDKNNNSTQQDSTTDRNNPKLTNIKYVSVNYSTILPLVSALTSDILLMMNNENMIAGGFLTNDVEAYVNQGVKISISSIPMPDLLTGKFIDNGFTYEEIVAFEDENLNKGIAALISGGGYKIGPYNSGVYSLSIPDGYYNLSISHASSVISKCTIIVGKPGGYLYPDVTN